MTAISSKKSPRSNGGGQSLDETMDDNSEPYLADDTAAVIDEAIDSLVTLRAGSAGDAGAQLCAIASLTAELESRVPEAVLEARDRGYTWNEIAARLGRRSAPATRRRFSLYIWLRKEMPLGWPH
jgi:hypothetical protein